jgi:AAA domain
LPKYFANNKTEFIFLFEKIWKCANCSGDEAYDQLADYGPNARKFLEIYLSYKFPGDLKYPDRLKRFFGEDHIDATLIERLHHEMTHMEGRIERALVPLDVPEMQQCARFILRTIEKKDREQYECFVEAIQN